MKQATTTDQQIALLRRRGMDVGDEAKAEEHLLDIGYYRLGFYWFPFEKSYPALTGRTHEFKQGTRLDDAVSLYYFDFDLRNILLRYISRIEINFRTTIVYMASNQYAADPYWYINPDMVEANFLESARYKEFLKNLDQEPAIRQHTKTHPHAPTPPAWKALEFATFGTIISLCAHLRNNDLRCRIARRYGFRKNSQMLNYMHTIRKLRNHCAHGRVLFDVHLDQAVCKGPLGDLGLQKTSLSGMCQVTCYLLRQISTHRAEDMQAAIEKAYAAVPSPAAKQVIAAGSGLLEWLKK